MSISAAMQKAEMALAKMMDAETGEFIFYNKEKLVSKIVVEVLVGFFSDNQVVKIIQELEHDK